MAAFDFNLGEIDTAGVGAPAAATFSLTTIHLASANTRVVVLISYFAASAEKTTGVTIGGASSTLDLRVINTGGSDWFELWSLPEVGGLVSGSAIVATFGGTAPSGVGGVLMGALSISGVDLANGGGVAGVGSSNAQTGLNWTSGTASAGGGIVVGGAGNEDGTTSIGGSMASGTKVHDNWGSGSQQGFQTAYLVGSTSVSGSFNNSGSTATTGGVVGYRDSIAAAASPLANVTASMRPRYR